MFCADFPPRIGLFLSLFVAKVFLSGRQLKPASQSASDTLGHKHTHIACGRRRRRRDVDEKISLQNHFFQVWNSLSIRQKKSRNNSLFPLIFLGNFLREFCSILSSFVRFILLVHRS